MYCKYLSKSLNGKIKCRYYKRYISLLSECQNCSNLILKRNKPIKKVSNKRITVTEETYNKVMPVIFKIIVNSIFSYFI